MNMDECADFLCKEARKNGYKLRKFELEKIEEIK